MIFNPDATVRDCPTSVQPPRRCDLRLSMRVRVTVQVTNRDVSPCRDPRHACTEPRSFGLCYTCRRAYGSAPCRARWSTGAVRGAAAFRPCPVEYGHGPRPSRATSGRRTVHGRRRARADVSRAPSRPHPARPPGGASRPHGKPCCKGSSRGPGTGPRRSPDRAPRPLETDRGNTLRGEGAFEQHAAQTPPRHPLDEPGGVWIARCTNTPRQPPLEPPSQREG